jgi:hypothetical protein
MAMEQISPGTRKTLTGCMVPSSLKRNKKKDDEKKTEKMKSKPVAFGFWKAWISRGTVTGCTVPSKIRKVQ